jgi:adenylate cyclase
MAPASAAVIARPSRRKTTSAFLAGFDGRGKGVARFAAAAPSVLWGGPLPRERRMGASIERRLAALLVADAAGYSRLMGRDEAGTLAALQVSRAQMAELIAAHRGRVVNAAGDSLLAEFASVVLAVECAVQMQRALAERNAALPDDRRMRFRIGINLGDVMVEGGDLYGDGVNIAARLQALAEPGGILISGPVFEQVKDKLAVGFDYLGPQAVKNIAGPVPAYRVLLQPGAAGAPPARDATPAPPPETSADARPLRRHRLHLSAGYAAALILLLLAINLFTWDGNLWAHWPTLGILFVLALRWLRLYRRP